MRSARGFTLIEILVAAGIFTLFFWGAYALYRSGTDMFITGSWKLSKQKDAQRFLTVLKERLEMTSRPTRIDPSGTTDATRIASVPTFVYLTPTPTGQVLFSEAPKNLLAFTLCKPDLTLTGGRAGLVFSHVLRLQPQVDPGNPAAVATLNLHGNTGTADPAFALLVPFPPNITSLGGSFNAAPVLYDLGAAPFDISLRDVASVRLAWQLASGTIGADECPKVVEITVNLTNPRHTQTQLSQSIRARLDPCVLIAPRTVGAL